jgi:hypothetical protein
LGGIITGFPDLLPVFQIIEDLGFMGFKGLAGEARR